MMFMVAPTETMIQIDAGRRLEPSPGRLGINQARR